MTDHVYVLTHFHSPWNASDFIGVFDSTRSALEYAKKYFGEGVRLEAHSTWYSVVDEDGDRVGGIRKEEVRRG